MVREVLGACPATEPGDLVKALIRIWLLPRREAFLVGGRIPELHRPFLTGGSESPAVGAECHASDKVHVTAQGKEFLAPTRIPALDHSIPTCRGNLPAVCSECHSHNSLPMPSQSECFLTCCRIPDLE